MKLDCTLGDVHWQEIRDRGWTWGVNPMGRVRMAGNERAASGRTICEAFHALKNALNLK